jgi:hypothetical protein
MSSDYYRALLAVAASLSLLVAGCGGAQLPVEAGGRAANQPPPQAATARPDAGEIDTEATLWTVLGLARKPSQRAIGPQTGDQVSPVLWQAALDTLRFAGTASEDPMTGLLVTEWYSPGGKPQERLRVSVYILSRALRSDSVAVTVEREERAASGWRSTPVAKDVVAGLETAILQRARQIHVERRQQTM